MKPPASELGSRRLMNFDLTDEQQMLQAAARDFLAARLNSEKIRALAESDDAFTRTCGSEIVGPRLARADGLRGPRRPGARHDRAGGADGAARLRARAGTDPLEHARGARAQTAATDEQRERWLAPLAAGEQRGTLALWDRGAGWTPDDVTLEPESSNGGFTLNGEKLFVLDAATRRLPDRRRRRATGASSSSATPPA